MKRCNGIFEKICTIENLREAHKNARKDKLFYREVKMVDADVDYYLKQIQDMLANKTYEVSKYETSIINDKGKERVLMKLPYYPDRIIQWAIMLQIEDVFMKNFCKHTCASIRDRGITRAQNLLKKYLKDAENTKYCLKLDVSKFYPNINHEILKKLLLRKFKDKDLLELLFKIIDSTDGDVGIPIGSYLSQFLANFYLSYFDHWLKEDKKIKYVVRYMDDIVVLHKSKEALHTLKREMDIYLWTNLKLKIKNNWQVFPVESRGVDFVGFRQFHDFCLLRKGTAKTFKRKMRNIAKKKEISYSEYCTINSYSGWLNLCDGYRLRQKYLKPVEPLAIKYYKEHIKKG